MSEQVNGGAPFPGDDSWVVVDLDEALEYAWSVCDLAEESADE